VFEEAKVADGVRYPYCVASRIHKDGYTDKREISLPELRQIFQRTEIEKFLSFMYFIKIG